SPGTRHPAPRTLFAFCLLLSASCLLPACGKRRPPQPPAERVPQRTELLSGVQRGNQIILSWPAPRRNAPDESVQSIRRVDVYRLAEEIDDPVSLTEEEFAARSTLVGSVPSEQISGGRDTVTYVDQLSLTDPVRLRYAVRYVNAANQRAAFSNFLLIEPSAGVSQPPVLEEKPEVRQDAVVLRWQAPTANVDASTPANLLGYNVYRAGAGQGEPARAPLNPEPLTATTFADQTFRFGEEYAYVVRAVSLGTGGEPVESLNSNAVTVTPLDTFEPAPPEGLTAVATEAPLRVSIFFAANKEPDVAGYNLHRSTDPELPRAEWPRLNRELLTRTTFQDEAVRRGTKYFYYVTAVDTAGNVSDPSRVASDAVPGEP
ncbi:MAG TPA: hypothetical protein VG148_17340, partial [Pyrinomonadaceae bacterium]|nr:hypothetical protein [Pyrinomonadaceae bacterium]